MGWIIGISPDVSSSRGGSPYLLQFVFTQRRVSGLEGLAGPIAI